LSPFGRGNRDPTGYEGSLSPVNTYDSKITVEKQVLTVEYDEISWMKLYYTQKNVSLACTGGMRIWQAYLVLFLPFFLPFFVSSISSSAFLHCFFIPLFAADDMACLHMDLAVDRGGNVPRLELGRVLVALEQVLAMAMGSESVLMSMRGVVAVRHIDEKPNA
jgi:hypothetical protein